MFEGSVSFVAQIKGSGLRFPKTEFDPHEAGVDKVEIEGPDGKELRSTVHFSPGESRDQGKFDATRINKIALDRLGFIYGTIIEDAQIKNKEFSQINPQLGSHSVAGVAAVRFLGSALVTLDLDTANVKNKLEQPSPPGEQYYGFLRSARQSASPVEEFMHMYHIILMLHNDVQENVDKFIVAEEPTVRQTRSPWKKGVMETVYTRLRNEFAHKRGVDLQKTKANMAHHIRGLHILVKRAIEAVR